MPITLKNTNIFQLKINKLNYAQQKYYAYILLLSYSALNAKTFYKLYCPCYLTICI